MLDILNEAIAKFDKNFFDGLIGRHDKKTTTEAELIQEEKERICRKRIRRSLEEDDELLRIRQFTALESSSETLLPRPASFKEYIGQKLMKESVKNILKASVVKSKPFPHTLFWGEAGLGKTSISYIIAREINANLILTSGGQLETKEELLRVFQKFAKDKPNILFIDEIHAVKRRIAEMLYSAMEDFRFDYTTQNNQIVSLYLPAFTVLGATTDMAKLLVPIRQRFQNKFQLLPYSTEELAQIGCNLAIKLGYEFDLDSLYALAQCSRGTARIMVNFVKNTIDYAIANGFKINVHTIKAYLNNTGIDHNGLTGYDRNYLKLLTKTKNFKAGINTLSKSLGIDRLTLENEIEPYLLRKHFITIGTGGRELTKEGYEYVIYFINQ